MLMSQANDLIVVFLALELLSIPLYVLAGFARPRADSEEASLKYFLMGAFAGGFVVFGVALVFGGNGSTNLTEIFTAIRSDLANIPLLIVGAALILVGMGFKVAAVPFHMWTPDVYQGSPSPVSAFMSVGAKAGGFAALLRIFISAFPDLSPDLTMILWTMAALTMFVGNVILLPRQILNACWLIQASLMPGIS
jgi:NADH-quinone oxidoreductase subunit N